MYVCLIKRIKFGESIPGPGAHLLHWCKKFPWCRVKKCWKTEAAWDGRNNMGINIKKLGSKSWFYNHLTR